MPLGEKRRKKGRQRRAPGRPGVARTVAYWDTYPIRKERKNGRGRKTRFSPEGRKEGGEEKGLFGTTGNRINAAKTSGYSTADRARLRAFGDNYRPADSISIGYHAPRASRAVDQSFSSKLKRNLLGVVALVAVIKNVVKPRDPRARGNDLPRK